MTELWTDERIQQEIDLAADTVSGYGVPGSIVSELMAQMREEYEAKIADDASVNSEIDKRLQAHNDVVAAKDTEIAKLQTELAQQKACYRVVARNLMTHGTINEKNRVRIAELTAELAAAKAEIATLAGFALDATNIFSYSTPPEEA